MKSVHIIICKFLISGILIAPLGCKPKVDHLGFLNQPHPSAKEHVLSLFDDHDIVILCERHHEEITQYELIKEIISDPYFCENIGHVYTEVGVASMDERINTFLQGESTDSAAVHVELTRIFRDIDFNPWWHCSSFPLLLQHIRKLNQSQTMTVQLHPCDVKFDWHTCRSVTNYKEWDSYTNRDSIMFENFMENYTKQVSNGKKKHW